MPGAQRSLRRRTDSLVRTDAMTTPHISSTPPRRGVSRRLLLGGGLAAALGVGGTTAWALDRFVIEHPEVTDASSAWAASTTTETGDTGTVTGQEWSDGTSSLSISQHSSGSGSSALTWFVADLRLASAQVLRTAFADDTFGENIIELPSEMASANDAVWALNGDYYGFRDDGIVIRNGVAFRDRGARQGLALDSDASLRLYDETATSASDLVASGVWQTWSFGPGLVNDGTVISGIEDVEVDTNPGNHSIQGTQPRTGIGMIEPGHLVAVAVDGRSSGYSVGIGMTAFAELFVGLGASVAYNLDGGGSTAMVFDGSLVNNPLGRGTERGTSDILYVRR